MAGNTARIVIDVDERESVEIPFEIHDNVTNEKTQRRTAKVKGSNARFYYIDMKDYERRVRADERKRIQQYKEKQIQEIKQKIKTYAKKIYQKSIGAGIVFCSISTIYSSYVVRAELNIMDWFIALFLIPVGCYLCFSKRFFFGRQI